MTAAADSSTSEPVDPRQVLCEALVNGLPNDASLASAASVLADSWVRRAKGVRLANPHLAKFALLVLRNMCQFGVRQSSSRVVLKRDWARAINAALRAAGSTDDNRNMAAYTAIEFARANNWHGDDGQGHVSLTDETLKVLGEPTGDWDVQDLPRGLRELAEALERLGGEAPAWQLLRETGRSPADTVKKYPSWNTWIAQHIKHVRRGVYRLE